MQDDDVYRFVVLRGRAPREPAPPSDPLIPAYSRHADASTAYFRDSVAAALGFGDVWQARWSADQLLGSLNVASAWELLTSLPVNVKTFFSALPRWARGRDRAAAESALLTAFSVTTAADLRMHHQAVVNQRSALADYLGACSLLAKERGDIDGAAHLICCCETTERLMLRFGEPEPNDEIVEGSQAGGEDGVCWLRHLRRWLRPNQPRAALSVLQLPSEPVLDWTVPLNLGIVTLPFVVGDVIRDDLERLRLASAGAAAMDIDTLMPRKFPSFEGDLIVLKQQIRRYELGEIAHVENVLAGETASRIYRNLRRTETRVLTQQEVETETTRDLQATTRDELRQEISRAMSEQRDLSANFTVTASYMGPGITVTASAGAAASYRRASEERNTTASEHAHEVVVKTSERVRERVLTQREAIESEEREETAKHEWKNDSKESIVGVYRWLERQFDLQLVNYGRRTIYEFTVPEPAAYWLALMTRRAELEAGPAPMFPQISPGRRGQPPPPPPLASRDLELADFEMQGMDNDPRLDDRPFKWQELLKLAGEWGVTMEEPPLPRIQLQVLLEVPPDAAGAAAQKAAYLGDRPDGSVAHRTVKVVATDESVKIPPGYRAYDGTLALRLYRRLVTYEDKDDKFVYENQKASLLLNGHKHDFKYYWRQTEEDDEQNISGLQWPTLIGHLIKKSQLPRQHWLEGEIKLALATTFNGGACSIVLDCERTSAHALDWARRMYALFAEAHRRRLEQYEDDKARAAERQLQWVRDAAGPRARDIERREIRRGVLSLLTENQLDGVGARVLSDSTDANEPLPGVPLTDLDELDNFARVVRFFEHAFDWSNMAYALHPYIYGRRSRWARLALADHDDAQFGAFLGAGAARVQVPVRVGCETHVEHFFNGCGVHPFEKRIPPFDSMQSIGVELAEGASGGFVTGPGRIYVADGSREVIGVGTVFRDPEDLDRELRLNGRIYVVEEVFGTTRLRLRTPYAGPALVRAVYGIGGIVVGETMTLRLPTTLVVIDKPGLALPEFPPRYVS